MWNCRGWGYTQTQRPTNSTTVLYVWMREVPPLRAQQKGLKISKHDVRLHQSLSTPTSCKYVSNRATNLAARLAPSPSSPATSTTFTQPSYAPHIAGTSKRGSTPAATRDKRRSAACFRAAVATPAAAAGRNAMATIRDRCGLRKEGKLAATVATAERALDQSMPCPLPPLRLSVLGEAAPLPGVGD